MMYKTCRQYVWGPVLILLTAYNAGLATEYLFEAEDAILRGCEPVYHSAASGGFRVRYFDEAGDSIRFENVPRTSALRIRYSLGRETIQRCSLLVDGQQVETVTFFPTGSWKKYDWKHYYAPLGGPVELVLTDEDLAFNRGQSCAAIDSITVQTKVHQSTVLYQDRNGGLIYKSFADEWGDHFIPDFSQCGYLGAGSERIPAPETIPVRVTLSPQAGDDTQRIQAAIDTVGRRPLAGNGFRGAVLLQAGPYEISGTLKINVGGIVLRGAGQGADGTVLVATGKGQRSLIEVSGPGSRKRVSDKIQVLDDYLAVGTKALTVDAIVSPSPRSPSIFRVGDRVMVNRPSTQDWFDVTGMNLLDNPWQPGSKDLAFDRVITAVDRNRITLDVPLTNAFDSQFGGGEVWKYEFPGRISHVGIEYIRGESEYAHKTDEDHGWNFIVVDEAEHVWVRNVTSRYFGYACVYAQNDSKWVTVQDCACLDPISQITGGRRYSFPLDGQLALVMRCYAREGRHDFVMHSLAPGPNAFVDCAANEAHSDTGPHHRWSTGVLYDNVVVNGNAINMRNRWNSGTGHGWAGANQIAWNARADSMIIEKPPTAQNWAIGCTTPKTRGDGFWEKINTPVSPTSLYEAQRRDRMKRSSD